MVTRQHPQSLLDGGKGDVQLVGCLVDDAKGGLELHERHGEVGSRLGRRLKTGQGQLLVQMFDGFQRGDGSGNLVGEQETPSALTLGRGAA